MSVDVLQLTTELLEAVTEAMSELLRTGDPRVASGRVLRAALQQTDSRYGFAGVMDGQTLKILNHEGMWWHESVNRALFERAQEQYERVGFVEFTNFRNLFGQVILTGCPIVANTPSDDPRSGGLPPGHPPVHSFLGVPVLSGDRVVGIIGVANRMAGYGPDEQHRLEVLAQMAGVIFDTYSRQQRESELQEHLRQAQKMEAVGQLAGGIAHDFNNLLMAIGGFTEFVVTTFDDGDPRRADLLEVQEAAKRAATLTRQLLAFSRRQILQSKVVDLNGLVADVHQLLLRTIPENIDLVLDLRAISENVRADPSQLQQVLMNLAVNAADAMPQGGELRFATSVVDIDDARARRHPPMLPGRYVCLVASDTGIGMSPETRARVFEPFFTTKEPGRGTGLGLATVYGIVKQSGGFIWLTSELQRGTRFEIYLPAVHEPVESAPPVAPHAEPTGGSETILLAEDDAAIRRLARDVLRKYGYHVLEARDGDEALSVAQEYDSVIHLLITDVVMPGLSGRSLADRLVMLRPDIRVLYSSGYDPNTTERVGLERGLPLLTKPYPLAELLYKVREVLDAEIADLRASTTSSFPTGLDSST